MNPAETLLENILAIAVEQIDAAKQLDAEKLEELTAQRQDLFFELELEKANNNISPSPKLIELKTELDEIDERLMAILSTVVQATNGVKTKSNSSIYGSNGRMTK